MESAFFEDIIYDNTDFSGLKLSRGEYEECAFNNCGFSQADLRSLSFSHCSFTGCNFSNAETEDAAFRDAVFKDCKMLGVRFDRLNPFGISFRFDHCSLSHSSFYKMKIKKTLFLRCVLQHVDFTETDLSAASFDQCDLTDASFDRTVLEKTDFRTAFGFRIDPEINRVKKARFSSSGLAGLLDKFELDISG